MKITILKFDNGKRYCITFIHEGDQEHGCGITLQPEELKELGDKIAAEVEESGL